MLSSEDNAMESRKPVHKLSETIHSLLGWKSHVTSNWVKSVCEIMKSVPPDMVSINSKPINVATEHSMKKKSDELHNSISKVEDEIAALTAYINQLNTQRRKVLNEFLDLRGNIRVFCRIRPIAVPENFGQLKPVAALDSSNVVLKLAKNKNKTYSFDKVFHPGSSQDEVFAEVEPVIKSALDGYNACIFAYGQTGTGKIFTMEGIPQSPGVVARAMEAIFKQAVDSNHVFVFTFSMLEIYLGNLKDLLVPQPTKVMDPTPPCLSIQTDAKGGIEIDNLVAIPVTDFNQALKLYKLGCRFRSTASTNSNKTSSRSHCLIRLSITCLDAPERRQETNKVWFVDLGGSERVLKTKASGRRLDEGKAINLSLSALGDVIHALQKKKFHVPYRNSKLTQVLKDSLGEDSKTLMLVHVSQKEEDICETLCSLNFATRVRSIHLGDMDSTEEREQKEIAIAHMQKKMKMIEDERREVRRKIEKFNEELQKLTGTAPSSNEQLEASHLLTKFNQHNLETTRSKTTEAIAAPLSSIPRFMKPTVCSTRKSGADNQTSEEKVKFPARRRRPLSHRAESVSFPVKRISENNSECSISRNSCLVDLNVKSNADETEYSQDATESDIKSIILLEQEMSSKSSTQQKDCLVNSDRYGKRKKNSFISTNFSKVDNWLRLHKNEPRVSTISQKSKRVLAIPVPEKKQKYKGKKVDDLQNGEEHNYKFTKKKIANNEKHESCFDVLRSGRLKQVEIYKPPINMENFINTYPRCDSIHPPETLDSEKILHTISLANMFMEENQSSLFSPPKIWGSSFDLNQDGNKVDQTFAMQKEGGPQSSETTFPEKNAWCKFSPSKISHCMFETRDDSGSSMSVSEQDLQYLLLPTEMSVSQQDLQCSQVLTEMTVPEQELHCSQVPTETGTYESHSEDLATVDLIIENSCPRPGIHNMRTQRALIMDNENPKEIIMTSVKPQENTEVLGICNHIIGKAQILGASALLVSGFNNLGLEHEFFYGLIL
ncbi:kinesin-like protein KIN-14T [Humulus lupulus]|uniref:kinesin-like protein KIN-14T n=1 Tax=Humulus lupulus TaxID=3486 RepID=UPI002B40DCA1|nr:kinesin-like protein KIN-14T [Humulus lupulus]